MRIPATLPFLVVLLQHSNAQSILWMRDAGSTPFSGNERGDAVDTDADGNAYVLGHLAIDSQFSGLPVPAAQDGCLAKYSAMGLVQWVRTFGGPGFVDIQESAVKVSKADNAVYACGQLRTQFANPTVHFGTDSFSYAGNSLHAFLVKYDLDGNFQWMRHGGGTPYGARFNDLDIDDQGRIVVVGSADGTNTFEGQTITSSANKGVLARYLPDGTLTDLVQLADNSNDQQATAVEVAPGTGNIYVGGGFWGDLQLNGFNLTAPTFSTFTLKLDDALNALWMSQGGGDNTTYGSWLNGLAIDAVENCYITGECSGDAVTFGAHSFIGHTFYDDEVFTAKINSNGVVQWLRRGGSEQNDEAFDIIADALGNTVITGLLGGNIAFADFDGIQVDIVSQSTHCFIARYDPAGTIAYAKRLGGGSDDVGSGLALANDSTFFLTGTTWGSTPWLNWNYQSCCLDPNLFIAKFDDTFNDITTSLSDVHFADRGLAVFPNPAADRITVSGLPNGTAIEVFDVHGRMVHRGRTGSGIDASAWAEGLYTIRAFDSDGRKMLTRTIVAR